MGIDLGLAERKYGINTPNAAPVWAARTAQESQKWEVNAKSNQAETNFGIAMQDVINRRARQEGLQDVSAGEFAQAVQASQDVYRLKTQGAGSKWRAGFEPAARIIDQVVATLPARIPGNSDANVDNRVKPIGRALQDAKRAGLLRRTGGGFSPSPAGAGQQFTPLQF